MKLTFRTIRGKEYQLEVDPEKTIGDVKQQLSAEIQDQPSDKLKLILQAKILKDDTVVSSISIPEHSYIVVHFINDTRPVVPKSKKPSPSTETVNTIPDEPKVPPQPQPDTQNQPTNRESIIEDLTSMGFEKKMAEKALNLADNNVEVAVTLLLNGTIKSEDDTNSKPTVGDSNQDVQVQPPATQANFGDLQNVYDQLSVDEKAAISRLLRYGSPEEVLQTYFACQKDEEITKACLQ